MADSFKKNEYRYGFAIEVVMEEFPKGINEEIIKLISSKRAEPDFVTKFRLNAFKAWQKMSEPHWGNFSYDSIDYQNIVYYSEPIKKAKTDTRSAEDIDPEILATFEKLGIPISERDQMLDIAVDAVFDSVSVATTYKSELKKYGIIFCSMREAIIEHPEIVEKYLGTVVPYADNFFAALNSAVFSDGSFCYIPEGVHCPLDLTTYFRINSAQVGQFERTLIIAEKDSYVGYLEGCSAPIRVENQLHAAVVELVALDNAEIKYSTVQNWYSGDKSGRGGIYNFVTKRGLCSGSNSKISWTQIEAGAAITWKYPSVILKGNNSEGSFYSVAVTDGKMQADTGTKMLHIGKNSKSKIIAKSIVAEESSNTYRGLVKVGLNAENSKCYSQCDTLIVGSFGNSSTFPELDISNNSSTIEHEASVSKINEEQLFYLQSRGISKEEAISLIVNGYCKEVFKELPLEFAVEAVKLVELKLENSIG